MAKRGAAAATSLLATATVAGIGLSAGRDTWRLLKRSSGPILFLIALAGVAVGPFLGCREMVRGHNRGVTRTVFKTLLLSLCISAAGIALGAGIILLAGLLTGSPGVMGVSGVLMVALALGGAFSGLIVGLSQRPSRKRAFEVARRNDAFLRQQGFRETGGDDITHYDGEGNALRFLEQHPDRIVFMVVGRRGKRACIHLAEDGAMLSYSGV